MDRNAEAIRRRVMPFTPISLEIEDADGSTFKQEWKLSINYNVLADAQEKCGYNFLGSLLEWVDDPNRLRALFWAALLPYQAELRDEFEAVGEYLDGSNRIVSIEALMKAFSRYQPKDKREKFNEVADRILVFLRTGKLPEETEKPAAVPLAESPSTGQNSAPSAVTTLASLTTTNSAA